MLVKINTTENFFQTSFNNHKVSGKQTRCHRENLKTRACIAQRVTGTSGSSWS